MLKIHDRVRFLGPDTPVLGIFRGMEGTVVGVFEPDGIYPDDAVGDLARFIETVVSVDFHTDFRSLIDLQNEINDRDPAFADVPKSTGIGVFIRQLERI